MKPILGILIAFSFMSCSVFLNQRDLKIEPDDTIDSQSIETSSKPKNRYTPFFDFSKLNWGLYDLYDQEISVPSIYDKLYHYKNGMYEVRLNDQMGIIDQQGREILPINHFSVICYEDVIVVKKNGLNAVFDDSLNEILPLEYSRIIYNSGLIIAQKDGKFGILNKSMDTIVPFEYDILDKRNGYFGDLIYAEKDRKYGLLNDKNKEILPIKYDFLSMAGHDYLGVVQDGKEGIYNFKGKCILKPNWKDLLCLGNSLFAVKNDKGLYGVINRRGKLIYPYQFMTVESAKDGILTYYVGGELRYEAIDLKTKTIITHSITPFYFSEGIAAVSIISNKQVKYGYKNLDDYAITPFKYDKAAPFEGGLGKVTLNGKFGLVDTSGIEVMPPEYDFISKPFDGKVFVKQNGRYHLRTTGNERLSENEYDFISFDYLRGINVDFILASNGDFRGFINLNGEEVIPFIYENARGFVDGFASVLLDGTNYLIDKKGVRIKIVD